MSNPYMVLNDIYYRAKHGSGRKFEFEHGVSGWTTHTVRQLLNARGISSGAVYIPGGTGGTASFRVSDAQAVFAEGIMRAAGVPLLGPVNAKALASIPADVGGRGKSKDPIGALQNGMAGAFGMGYDNTSKETKKRRAKRAKRRTSRRRKR